MGIFVRYHTGMCRYMVVVNMTQGLKHIHENNLIHLDIKPGNILFSKSGPLKIGDFGLTTERKAALLDNGEGDCLYVAPELFEGIVTAAADIFSLGATIFEMATNIVMPKNGKLWQDLRSGASFSVVANAPRRSRELEELVKYMMEPKPTKRITVDQILTHPVLKQLQNRRENTMDQFTIEDISGDEDVLDERVIASRSTMQKNRGHQRTDSLGRKLDDDDIFDPTLGFSSISPVNLMAVRDSMLLCSH